MNNSHVWRATAAMAAVMASGPSLSDSLDLNLNDDAARLTYAGAVSDGRLEFDVGWLHNDKRGNAWNVSLGRIGEAGGAQQPVTAGLGGRLYVLDPDLAGPGQDGVALGVGGFFRMKLAGYDRIGFSGHGYFAPDVIAFGDAEDVLELAARVTYSVIREADVYLGLRFIEAGFDGRDVKFDSGLHIGIRLEF